MGKQKIKVGVVRVPGPLGRYAKVWVWPCPRFVDTGYAAF